jgi:hypothetical protein
MKEKFTVVMLGAFILAWSQLADAQQPGSLGGFGQYRDRAQLAGASATLLQDLAS